MMLQVEGIHTYYGLVHMLHGVSLKVAEGEFVGLLGRNGAGKSTLMYTISGIILDRKVKEERRGGERITIFGQIKYRGENIITVKPSARVKRGIVLCPERRRVFPECNVLENLRIGAYLRNRTEEKEMIQYVWELFPALYGLKKRKAGFLSGGEQQMLAIGRALMARPELLLLDEPCWGLPL